MIGAKYAIGVNSGTDAIKLSLKSIGVGPGDEVITAANTFVATVGAINELEQKVAFVDCDDSFCMNVDLLEKKITKNKSNSSCSSYWINASNGQINEKNIKKTQS